MGTMLSPPSRRRGILGCENVDSLECINRVTRLYRQPATQGVQKPLPECARPCDNARRKKQATVTPWRASERELEPDPGFPNCLRSLARRAGNDADRSH